MPIETCSQSTADIDLVKRGPLQRLNNLLERVVVSRLSSDQGNRVELAFRSARAATIPSPASYRKALSKAGLESQQFSPGAIDEMTQRVEEVASSLEGEFIMGAKVLDLGQFQKALDKGFRAQQLDGQDSPQQKAFDYWVTNLPRLRTDKVLPKRVLKRLGEEAWREGWISTKLLSMLGGIGLKQAGETLAKRSQTKGAGKALSVVGNGIIEVPVVWQAIQDIKEVEAEDKRFDSRLNDIVGKYGLSFNNPVIRHRNALLSLHRAASIFTAGEGIDQYLGHGVYLASFGIFMLPGVRETINAHQQEILPQLMLGAYGISGVRALINSVSLLNRRQEYCPDLVGTALYVFSSKAVELIGEKKGKQNNPILSENDKPNNVLRGATALGASAIGALAYLNYQVVTYTLPASQFGPESTLASWVANVFDEAYWAAISSSVAIKGLVNKGKSQSDPQSPRVRVQNLLKPAGRH